MRLVAPEEQDTKRKTQHVYSWIIAHVGLAYYRYGNIISIIIISSSSRVVLVAAVVLLLSLLLISRSSGDNSEKNSWQFSGVFAGFLCSFLKVHLSKARRMASTLPPNFSQNSSRSRA